MITVRIHGRGGQGNVTLAELIAMASFYQGKQVQAFPFFGVERKGAPVSAFVKIDDKFIRSREQVYQPDYIIIQDPSLISSEGVLDGIKKETVILINSNKSPEKICPAYSKQVFCAPVLEIALKTIGKPIINTAMLGVFAKISGLLNLKSAEKAIRVNLGERYGEDIILKNINSLSEAFNSAN